MRFDLLLCVSLFAFVQFTYCAPSDLDRIEIRSSSITMTWKVESGTSYKILVQQGCDVMSNPSESLATSVTTSPFKVEEISGNPLEPRTRYDIAVFDGSSYSLFVCVSTGPAPPTNVQIISYSHHLDVSWDYEDDWIHHPVIGFDVLYRRKDSGETPTKTSTTETSTTLAGLESNTDYRIIGVIAETSLSLKFSDNSDATSGTTIPDVVNSLTNSTNPSTNSVTLQWDAVSGTSSSLRYKLIWNPASADGVDSKDGILSTSAVISNLIPSTEYTFTVKAENDGGSGQSSVPFSYRTLPSAPTVADSTTMISVEWTASSGGDDIDNYIVTWSPTSDLTNKMSTATMDHVTGKTSYSYLITGLTSGESYYVTCRGRNQAGYGPVSATGTYRTMPGQVATPTAIVLFSKFVVSWSPPSGKVDFYYVKLYKAGVTSSIHMVGPEENSLSVENLEHTVLYSASVIAVSGGIHSVESSRSNEKSF